LKEKKDINQSKMTANAFRAIKVPRVWQKRKKKRADAKSEKEIRDTFYAVMGSTQLGKEKDAGGVKTGENAKLGKILSEEGGTSFSSNHYEGSLYL